MSTKSYKTYSRLVATLPYRESDIPSTDQGMVAIKGFAGRKGFHRDRWPMNLAAGTWLSPTLEQSVRADMKLRKFPETKASEKSSRAYVAEFERLNKLTHPPISWVRIEVDLVDGYVEHPQREAA